MGSQATRLKSRPKTFGRDEDRQRLFVIEVFLPQQDCLRHQTRAAKDAEQILEREQGRHSSDRTEQRPAPESVLRWSRLASLLAHALYGSLDHIELVDHTGHAIHSAHNGFGALSGIHRGDDAC